MLIANVNQALREAGRVGEAARLVIPASEDAPGTDRWPIHIGRINVESARGNATTALERSAADAQEHAPLHRAIAATVSGGR